MERRNFIRAMLGVAAATALPSEVWPFRKIFVPTAPKIVLDPRFTFINAVCLEYWSKDIPDLLFTDVTFHQYARRYRPGIHG